MRLTRLHISLYVGLIFLSGILVGVFGQRLYTVNTVTATTARNPDEWRQRFVTEMTKRLNLRAEQKTDLNHILDESRTRVHEVHEKYRPEMESIRQQQNAKIRTILDDQQRTEFEKMREERERNMKKSSGSEKGPGI